MFLYNIVFLFGVLVQVNALSNAPNKIRNPTKHKRSNCITSTIHIKNYSIPNKRLNKKQAAEVVEAMIINDAVNRLLGNSETLDIPSVTETSPTYTNITSVSDHLKNSSLSSKTESFKGLSYEPLNLTHHQVQQLTNQEDKSALLSVYNKLAADFQLLQQYLVDSTKKDCQQKCAKCTANITTPTCKPQLNVETKNMITLENISKDDGNFTRITLLRKKISETKRNVDLPYFPCQTGKQNNIRFRITNQEDDIS